MRVYGYIGIITEEKNKDRQQESLKEYAVKNNVKYTTVFEDKLCEKSFERPHYRALHQIIKRGDIVIIKGYGMLGRNYREIQRELQKFQISGITLLIVDILMLHDIQDELLDTVSQGPTINLVDYVA